jgi:hypothetical protein
VVTKGKFKHGADYLLYGPVPSTGCVEGGSLDTFSFVEDNVGNVLTLTGILCA